MKVPTYVYALFIAMHMIAMSACSGGYDVSPLTPQAPPSAALGDGSLVARTLDAGGQQRYYNIYTPPHAAHPTAAIYVLHGYRGDAGIARYYGMERVADRNDFLVIYPEAPSREWNVGMNFPNTSPEIQARDDLAYFDAIHSDLQSLYGPALHHFLAGQSQGGLMAVTLACLRSHHYAGVAIVASGMTNGQASACTPAHPLPFLLIVGERDRLLPPVGGRQLAITGADGAPIWLLDYTETADHWARHNQCHDYIDSLVRGARVRTFIRCEAPLQAYMIANMGHRWPGVGFQEQIAAGDRSAEERAALGAQLGPASYEIDGAQLICSFFARR